MESQFASQPSRFAPRRPDAGDRVEARFTSATALIDDVSMATAKGRLGCQSLTRGFGRLRLHEACGLEFVPDGNGHNRHR